MSLENRALAPTTALILIGLGAACGAPKSGPAPVVHLNQSQNHTAFIGEGRLSHAPEYVELTMTITSECFPTPLAASQATDAAVAKAVRFLRGKIDKSNPKDGVFTRGGFTRPFSRYVSVGVTVCRGTFQKTSTITMKSSRVAQFDRDFATIQRMVLGGSLRKTDDPRSQDAITFANLGTPTPRLYHQTRERLEQEALAKALANARKKLAATIAVCGKTSPRIVKLEEKSVHGGRPIPYARSQPRTGDANTTVELPAIWINKLLHVYFHLEPNACT